MDSSHPLSKLIRSAKEGEPAAEGDPARTPAARALPRNGLVHPRLAPRRRPRRCRISSATLSEGNPLFVSESLSYLHNEDLLFLDEERQWRWDLDKIRQSRMPTTVVALFSSKIQKLPAGPDRPARILRLHGQHASRPPSWPLIREMTLLETFETLKPALGQGLLMENKNQLQFIHDKVQEAALSAIPAERRRQIHWQVGNHLLSAVPDGRADLEKLDNLFTIVSHLNLGQGRAPGRRRRPISCRTSTTTPATRRWTPWPRKRRTSTSDSSRELLPADCWEDGHYERTFRIFQKAAKTELMCGNYENSERLLTELLDHAKTDLDKAECLAEQTTSLSSIGNFIKAIETANRGLAYFGKAIPDDPDEADRRRKELMAEIASRDIDVWETILNMPFTTDRKSKIELAFYSELIPDLYMSGLVPQLYLSAAQSTQHCLAGGMDESVIYSFSIMGLQLGEQEEFEQAFRYEDLARDLSAKYPNTFGATRGMNGIVWCNMHSRSHPQRDRGLLPQVDPVRQELRRPVQRRALLRPPDVEPPGPGSGPVRHRGLRQGMPPVLQPLPSVLLRRPGRGDAGGLDRADEEGLLPGPHGGEAEAMGAGQPRRLRRQLLRPHGPGALLLRRAREGRGVPGRGPERYLSGLTDNVLKRQWHVFRVLNALKLYETGTGAFRAKRNCWRRSGLLIQKIETWASSGASPETLSRLSLRRTWNESPANLKEARSLYLDAINAAHEQEYTFLEGHLNECLGELLRQAGQCSAQGLLRRGGAPVPEMPRRTQGDQPPRKISRVFRGGRSSLRAARGGAFCLRPCPTSTSIT